MQYVVQNLLPSCTFCWATQRFVPGPKAGTPASLAAHEEASMLWGPGGTAFPGWVTATSGFFGVEHLEAFHRICGEQHCGPAMGPREVGVKWEGELWLGEGG